jgi:hypothetical protein
MVAPAIIGAGIGAVGNLIGGILGRNSEKKAIAAQNAYNDPAAVRARWEAAGFNPLLGVSQGGVGVQSAVGGTNFIGSAIADSISSVASAWSDDAAAKAERDALASENETLRRKVEVETIRPVQGGMYSKPQGTRISISGPANGWVSEYDADFVGKQVRQGDGYYEQRNPARTSLRTPLGYSTPADQSDAEDYEMRYGDPVSWAVGLANIAADTGASLRSWTDKKGWTSPDKWVGQDTIESVFKSKKDTLGIPKPSGYTEAGNPFWVQPDGSVKWKYEK